MSPDCHILIHSRRFSRFTVALNLRKHYIMNAIKIAENLIIRNFIIRIFPVFLSLKNLEFFYRLSRCKLRAILMHFGKFNLYDAVN